MKKHFAVACAALLLQTATASAHYLWVNAYKAEAHTPPHALISLGWGHTLPMDDKRES